MISPSIYVYIFLVVSFLLEFPPEFCTHSRFLPCVLHASPWLGNSLFIIQQPFFILNWNIRECSSREQRWEISAPKHKSSFHLVISNLLRNVVGPACGRTWVTWPYEERNYQLTQRILESTSSVERNGWRVMDNAVWGDWCLPSSDFRISRQKIAPLIKALFIYTAF
jgi:hypothetical protein